MVDFPEFSDLVGEEVGSVCFVRDFVELHFDGPILRSLADPVLHVSGSRYEFPKSGSRDALCRLIGYSVHSTTEEPKQLVIDFAESGTLLIPRFSKMAGPEVAHFVPFVEGRLATDLMLIWENLSGKGS